MKIKHILQAFLVISIFSSTLATAQDDVTFAKYESSGCTKQALEEIIKAISRYRSDNRNWNSTVTQFDFTLGGVPQEQQGILELPINTALMNTANETARRFADGTYSSWQHVINGEGPTMRAIRNGWKPSMNKLFYANEEPVFTMVTENLWEGSSGYTWKDVLNAWEKSPGHNTALLSRGAVSIGCGCADTKPDGNGQQDSYWVLLVELEDSMTESDEVMERYFKEGVFYKIKKGMKKSDLTKYKSEDIYEFIDSGLQQIKEGK